MFLKLKPIENVSYFTNIFIRKSKMFRDIPRTNICKQTMGYVPTLIAYLKSLENLVKCTSIDC